MAAYDCESTGVDVESDRIVTATVVRINPGEQPIVRNWLINPGVEIPRGAIDVHGVTNERARAEGIDPAEALEEIAEALAHVWRNGIPVIAYNACFDLTLLDRELRRYFPEPAGVYPGSVIDPLVLDKQVDRYRKGSRKLVDACKHYQVPIGEAHTSDADALAAARVAWRIAQRYPDVGGMPLAELQQAQTAWYAAQQISFKQYLGRCLDQAEDLDEQKKLRGRIDGISTAWPVKPYRAAEVAA